jgi:hypothetical protein
MKKICIIAPDPQELYNRFKEHLKKVSPHTAVLLFSLDISNTESCALAVRIINHNNPDYVLIGLDFFDQENSKNEFELSVYLEGKHIPAHFVLADELGISNPEAIHLSLKTGIKDLLVAPPTGEEFCRCILSQVAIYRMPKLKKSAAANGESNNDLDSPYIM